MTHSYDRRKVAGSPNVKPSLSAVEKAKALLGDLETALSEYQKAPSEKTAKAAGSAFDKLESHFNNKVVQSMAKLLDESDGRKPW